MNVLFLVPKLVFDTKMARERFVWMQAVQAQVAPHGVDTWGPGWPKWDESKTPDDNVATYMHERSGDREAHPHFIVPYMVRPFVTTTIPRVVILQEAYNRPKVLAEIRAVDAKLVIFTYANEMPQFQAELEAEGRVVKSIGHCADDHLYQVLGSTLEATRTVDVLIVGNMNQAIYPFRNRLARLAWRDLRKRGYRVSWLPHPGYTLPPKAGVVGPEYVARLNSAKLVVTCTSRFKYALTKLAEIPLCGALPVSDVPGERERFFEATMLHVEPWMLDREIRQAMEDVLDSPDDWARRVKIARDKVEARLVMKYWAERFIYQCRRVLGEVDMAGPMPEVGPEDT